MIVFDYNDECVDCGVCAVCCPVNAIAYDDASAAYFVQHYDLCLIERTEQGFEICVGHCPGGCIFNNGEETGDADSIIDQAKMEKSFEKWAGTPYLLGGNSLSGIDCSNFVLEFYKENGLDYTYHSTSTFTSLSCFFEVTFPMNGDVVLWAGHHMGIYVSSPSQSGYHIYGATTSKGVRYGKLNWWSDRYGNPKYYRY